MSPQLYIDPEGRLSKVPYRVPNNRHYVTLDQYQLMELQLKAEVERLKEGNDCLGQMHDKEMERSAYLREEFNRSTAWGRGLESDLSHARVEVSFLKAEVERLRASSFVTAVPVEQYERLVKAGDAMASSIQFNEEMAKDYNGPTIVHKCVQSWNAAKEREPI